MKKLIVLFALVFSVMSAHASMIWLAVAVEPAQFEQFRTNSESLTKALFSKGEHAIKLDKDWHGIHFLLTGTAWDVRGEVGQAILGGNGFGEDMGYGPARVLSVPQVKVVAEALAKNSSESLSARYNPEAMTKAEIYPTVIWNREGAQALAPLLNSYKALVTFYQRAAEKGQLVVIAMM